MDRDGLTALRDRLIRGSPPYERGPLGNMIRHRGTQGIDELRAVGEYNPGAGSLLMGLESILLLVEHLLDRMKPR